MASVLDRGLERRIEQLEIYMEQKNRGWGVD